MKIREEKNERFKDRENYVLKGHILNYLMGKSFYNPDKRKKYTKELIEGGIIHEL